MDLRLCSLRIGPSRPSKNDLQVIRYFSSHFLRVSRLASRLTPTRAKGLPSNLFTSDRSCDTIFMQAPHHSAQKVSTTTFPWESDSLNSLPSPSLPLMSGMVLPTL